MRRALVAGLLLAASASTGAAQSVVIQDQGPGEGGRILRAALSTPHRLIAPATSAALLPRGSNAEATVIVLGRSAIVGGTVHGDVIVVGGDLYLHPGAQIDGRAVAIGGGAYRSLLAIVRGGYLSFRDYTYDVRAVAGGFSLSYRRLGPPPSPPVTLAGIYGFGFPSYDRSDGLSLPFGPDVSLDSARVTIAPTLTYRSQLGRLDPAVTAEYQPSRLARIEAFAGRSTFTNDAWIWSDMVNSAAAFFLGNDARNYYRADRAQVIGHYVVQLPTASIEPLLGIRTERAWSVRPDTGARGGPWSVLGRHSVDDILRPNPRVDDGGITSALAGANVTWQGDGGVAVTANVATEISGSTPSGAAFVQTTTHATAGFPTFGNQRFDAEAHWVLTSSSSTPRQRWVYIGGSGTLPFLGLLTEGGDELLYVQSAYSIPVSSINIPFVGAPTVQLRHVMGSAGVQHLPSLEQNVGVRLIVSFLRVDALADPARGRVRFSAGLSMAR